MGWCGWTGQIQWKGGIVVNWGELAELDEIGWNSTFNYVVPLTMLSLNLDIHRVVKNHKTIHYLSPQGEGKQSSLLSLLVIILLSGNIIFKIICQRIIWSHIILNVEWYVSPFTCRWMRAMFVSTFSPLREKVYTNMVLIHQQVKKSTLGKIVKNCQKIHFHNLGTKKGMKESITKIWEKEKF